MSNLRFLLIFCLFFILKLSAQIFVPFAHWSSLQKPLEINQCPVTPSGSLSLGINYESNDATTCAVTAQSASLAGTASCGCVAGVCTVTGLTLTRTYLSGMSSGQNNILMNALSVNVTRPNGVFAKVQNLLVKTGTWNPNCLGTVLLMWLDATDQATVFQDTAGLVMVTNGTSVARWNDKSGHGVDATQATAGNRPVYNTGVDTYLNFTTNWSSIFTFMNSTLSMNGVTGFNGAVGSMFGVVNSTSTGGNSYISLMSFRNGGGNLTGFSTPNSTNWGMDWWTNGVYNWNTGAAITNGANAVIGFSNTSGAQTFSLNGTIYANTVATTTISDNATTLVIGNDPCCGNTRYYNGRISELLIIKENLSASVRSQVEGYLAWKYGTSGTLPGAHAYKNYAP